MAETFKKYCSEVYANIYTSERERLLEEAVSLSRNGNVGEGKANDIETAAQKESHQVGNHLRNPPISRH